MNGNRGRDVLVYKQSITFVLYAASVLLPAVVESPSPLPAKMEVIGVVSPVLSITTVAENMTLSIFMMSSLLVGRHSNKGSS